MESPRSLEATRLMVIAAHPDDQALGCGGIVAASADAGSLVCTVFMTDGSASTAATPDPLRDQMASRRRSDAARALSCLGVGNHPRIFLDLPDGAMPKPASAEGRTVIAHLRGALAKFRPDVVLLPWRRDPHSDHRDSWHIATAAIDGCDWPIRTLEYAIWLDERGGPDDRPRDDEAEAVRFDVSPFVEMKRSAIAAYVHPALTFCDKAADDIPLSVETVTRLTGPVESFWRPLG